MNQGRDDSSPEDQAGSTGDFDGERQVLLRTWNDGEAMMIRQLLASYGIPCQVVSDLPHAVFPLSVDGLGEIRILVGGARIDEARSLLAEHLRQGLEVIDGGRAGGDSPSSDVDPLDGSGNDGGGRAGR